MKNSGGVDVEVLARKTVEMLGVAPGQVIWIWANVVSMDFIEALAYHIRARGAFWTLRLNSLALLHRIGMEVPAEYLPLLPEHELRWLDDIDAIIEVRDHGGHLPGVPLERQPDAVATALCQSGHAFGVLAHPLKRQVDVS